MTLEAIRQEMARIIDQTVKYSKLDQDKKHLREKIIEEIGKILNAAPKRTINLEKGKDLLWYRYDYTYELMIAYYHPTGEIDISASELLSQKTLYELNALLEKIAT